MKFLRTSDLARAAGVHPNTVRLYVEWGLLPPVERSPSGYRRFTPHHLECLRLARLIYAADYPGRALRGSGHEIIQCAAAGDWSAALGRARAHLEAVRAERGQAEAAAALVERWAQGRHGTAPDAPPLSIGEACRALDVSRDALRNWERNGLIRVPRASYNGFRRFGPAELERLRVIRMLSRAGYSQMAMLRMFLEFEAGRTDDLRGALDTPRADEDLLTAADRWLTTLAGQEHMTGQAIRFIEERLARGDRPEESAPAGEKSP